MPRTATPEPYGVKYIGIGNEEVLFNGDRADEYDHYVERFNLLHDAIKGKDPSVKLISTAWWRADSPSMERTFRALDGKADYWDYHPWADQLASGRGGRAGTAPYARAVPQVEPLHYDEMRHLRGERQPPRHAARAGTRHASERFLRRMGDFFC